MIRRILAVSLLSCLIATPANPQSKAPWREKPLGVLLIGEGGGADWNNFVRDLRKSFRKKYPMETFVGPIATRGIQRALDRLQNAKAQQVVVIPMYLDSRSKEIEQIQYILGLRKFPSEAFLDSWGMRRRVVPRAKVKVPLVMGEGLGNDPVAADILLSRAREMSRDAERESVLIVARGAGDEAKNGLVRMNLDAITTKVTADGPFMVVQGALLRPPTEKKPRQDEDSLRALRTAIKNLSVRSRVILVPHLLARDGTERAWRKKLDNLFFRWKGKAMLPDARLVWWVEGQVEKLREQPNMVRYKDEGQALPPPKRKSRIR